MDKNQDKAIKEFISRVKGRFQPKEVLLFGSRARGNHWKGSDYDIAIISEKFKDIDFRERIIMVYELVEEPLNVEVLCYTPEEFEKRKDELCIVRKIFEEGVSV